MQNFDVFGWFHQAMLPEWAWVVAIIGLVMSVIGIAMAVGPFLQMWFGRGKVEPTFRLEPNDPHRSLHIFLLNPPITSALLNRLGVERDTVKSLSISFRIAEGGSGIEILPIHQAKLYTDDQPDDRGVYRISLPPTYSVQATAIIVHWDSVTQAAAVPPDRLRGPITVPTGRYRADFVLLVNGKTRRLSRSFIVGAQGSDLNWITPTAAAQVHGNP